MPADRGKTALNWREIDALLAEWPIGPYWLKRIRQPDYRRIILEFSGPGSPWAVAVVLQSPYVRIHRLADPSRLPVSLPKPPRFAAVLKARLDGARLDFFNQIARDRIVRFNFLRGDQRLYLDAKLWSGGANLILSDAEGIIIDAHSRRPKRGEIPGKGWPPEGIGLQSDSWEEKTLRTIPGEDDWNRRVEAHFDKLERHYNHERRVALWDAHLSRRENILDSRLATLNKRKIRFESQLRDGHWADIIMAHLHRIRSGETMLEADDWDAKDTTVRIPLEPAITPRENADRYYARQKRASRALTRLAEDEEALENTRNHILELRRRLHSDQPLSDPFHTDPPDAAAKGRGNGPSLPGLWIHRNPYLIVVGRNAGESDTLLRRWARGNDLWLHVRDWPGGHVFVRAPRRKTVPLDLLLDAGNLALSYSKAKATGEADLYYTPVKNLRRTKDGKTGAVLPTREKNLRIRLDPKRLERLKEAAETS